MIRKVSLAVIMVGIILMAAPNIANETVRVKTEMNVEAMEEMPAEEMQENQQQEAEFNYDVVEDIGIAEVVTETVQPVDDKIIGQLLIPDIGLNLPIMKGISNSSLLGGAGTMKENQIMGEGNYALAGHYNKNRSILFGGLMEIQKGSLIFITDKTTVYEYLVYETIVVPDTEMDRISDKISEEKGVPVISLMTCYYSSKTGKRFFAVGELVKKYPYDEEFAGKYGVN